MPAMAGSQEGSVARRNFLKIAASAAVLATPEPRVGAQEPKPAAKDTGGAAEAGGDNPYTRGMAEFVAGLRYDQIPTEVIERIKLLMLDSLGCALYGVDLEWSRILLRTLTQIDK